VSINKAVSTNPIDNTNDINTTNSEKHQKLTLSSKPHRRVLLTQPSPIVNQEPEPESSPVLFVAEGEQTRMTVFLRPEETERLEEVWIAMRLSPARPSKGDIVRAAMALAFADTDQLEKEIRRRKGV
jgi:hypothetical protein